MSQRDHLAVVALVYLVSSDTMVFDLYYRNGVSNKQIVFRNNSSIGHRKVRIVMVSPGLWHVLILL